MADGVPVVAALPAPPEAAQGMRAEPRLHAGVCSGHGGFLVFWCRSCKTWLCSNCTIVDHPQDSCSVISLKGALEDFLSEGRQVVDRMTLRLSRALSLKTKCAELSAATRIFLQTQEEFLGALLQEEESLQDAQHKNAQRMDKLKRLTDSLAKDSVDPESSEMLQEMTGCLYSNGTDMEEKIEQIQKCFARLQISDILTEPAFPPSLAADQEDLPTCQSVSDLTEVISRDPDASARSFLLERTEGAFDWEDVSQFLGRENVEHLEQVLEDLYLATAKNQEVRDYIVSKVWTMRLHGGGQSWNGVVIYGSSQSKCILPKASGAFRVHSVEPVSARVQGVLAGIPSFVASRGRQDLVSVISSRYPSLQDVALEPSTWPGSSMRSGTFEVKCVTTDLVALDSSLRTQEGLVCFGRFKGRFRSMKAEPLSAEDLLPKQPFQQGFSVDSWSWTP